MLGSACEAAPIPLEGYHLRCEQPDGSSSCQSEDPRVGEESRHHDSRQLAESNPWISHHAGDQSCGERRGHEREWAQQPQETVQVRTDACPVKRIPSQYDLSVDDLTPLERLAQTKACPLVGSIQEP
jgi:hypothetical protein